MFSTYKIVADAQLSRRLIPLPYQYVAGGLFATGLLVRACYRRMHTRGVTLSSRLTSRWVDALAVCAEEAFQSDNISLLHAQARFVTDFVWSIVKASPEDQYHLPSCGK